MAEDAQSSAERAALRFRSSQESTDLETQGAYDKTDFAEALRRMNVQRPVDEQNVREDENRQGLFYSGQLGKNLDTLATDYARREGDARQEYDRREAARVAARDAIARGMSVEDAAISASLADRQIGRDTDAADRAALVPNPAAAAKAPRDTARINAVRKALMAHGPNWNQRARLLAELARLRG